MFCLCSEEELKRLHKALGTDNEYGQVEYKYGDDKKKQEIKKEKEKEDTAIDEQDEPFDPPPNLDIPPNMVIVSNLLELYCARARASVCVCVCYFYKKGVPEAFYSVSEAAKFGYK